MPRPLRARNGHWQKRSVFFTHRGRLFAILEFGFILSSGNYAVVVFSANDSIFPFRLGAGQ